jgi:hypothetical protein
VSTEFSHLLLVNQVRRFKGWKNTDAMRYYSKVLELSKETAEDSGCTEARLWCHTAIADCYVELGELERAAKV